MSIINIEQAISRSKLQMINKSKINIKNTTPQKTQTDLKQGQSKKRKEKKRKEEYKKVDGFTIS